MYKRQVTDHHALITTGIAPEGLSEAEEAVYTLIAGRMLEAFSPCCEKEQILMDDVYKRQVLNIPVDNSYQRFCPFTFRHAHQVKQIIVFLCQVERHGGKN